MMIDDVPHDRHDLELRDVEDRELVVSYNAFASNPTWRGVRVVSSRLPIEFLSLFDGGTVEVADLTDEERAWIRAEAEPNDIDFEGVAL